MISRFVHSPGYLKFRLMTAALSVLIGITVGVRFFLAVGFSFSGLTGYVLAAAMIALGVVKIRGIMHVRSQPQPPGRAKR